MLRRKQAGEDVLTKEARKRVVSALAKEFSAIGISEREILRELQGAVGLKAMNQLFTYIGDQWIE